MPSIKDLYFKNVRGYGIFVDAQYLNKIGYLSKPILHDIWNMISTKYVENLITSQEHSAQFYQFW